MKTYVIVLVVIVIFIVVCCIVCCCIVNRPSPKCNRPHHLPVFKSENVTNPTIFISICSYRDSEAPHTLVSLFSHASRPECITAGVCQQNENDDPDILDEYMKLVPKNQQITNQIRVYRMLDTEARGPVYARYLIEKHLFQNETYYMIVDSHTQFVQNWDILLIKEYQDLVQQGVTKPVLTLYPDGYDVKNRALVKIKPTQTGGYLRWTNFNDRGMINMEGQAFVRKPSQPLPSVGWAACCSFASSSMLKDVPYDPHLEYVFIGEESSIAARLYTNGYDLYSPTFMPVYTAWSRAHRRTFWDVIKWQKERESYEYLFDILGLPSKAKHPDFKTYGMGSQRSLKAYFEYCGMDLHTRQITSKGKRGAVVTESVQEITNLYRH